jgi:hypothetical protein
MPTWEELGAGEMTLNPSHTHLSFFSVVASLGKDTRLVDVQVTFILTHNSLFILTLNFLYYLFHSSINLGREQRFSCLQEKDGDIPRVSVWNLPTTFPAFC